MGIFTAFGRLRTNFYQPSFQVRDPLAEQVQQVQRVEKNILERGRPLTPGETEMARAVGVREPQKVRVLSVKRCLRPTAIGMTAGYGIMLSVDSRENLAHELTHVAQGERLGFERLQRETYKQMRALGHDRAPLETEAKAMAKKFGG